MTTGAGAASLLVLAWAQVSDLAAFYAIWVGIGLAMAAALYEPAFAVIASWYRDPAQRNRALLGLTVIGGLDRAVGRRVGLANRTATPHRCRTTAARLTLEHPPTSSV